jgi:hypothetical protein
VDFYLGNLVVPVIAFLHPEEDFTRDNLVVKSIEFADLVFDKFEESRVGVEMDGMDLHLHGCEVLILRSNVQRTVLMQLLQP